MKANDIIKHEFIGRKIKIVDSKNKNLIGIKGKVIDETKNMLMLDNGKKLIKNQCIFDTSFGKETIRIDGKVLVGRPEDRLKKKIK